MVSLPTLCIVCKRAALPRAQNSAFPFCSERCKLLDLGKWFDEKYGFPATESENDNDHDADTEENA